MNLPRLKPRIFKIYYPKLNRAYWRVSHMPKPFNKNDYQLWEKAYHYIAKLNSGEVKLWQ